MKKTNVLVVFVFVILAFSVASLLNQNVHASANESATSQVTTLLSSSTITFGDSVTDTATVSGVPGVVPTGSVSFYVSTDGGTDWSALGTAVTLNDGTATSILYAPSAASATGTSYEFYAVYSGDTSYLSSPSTDEPLTVNQVSATVTTVLSSSAITLGGSVTETATAQGVLGVVPTEGPMYFYVSTDGGVTWTLFDTEPLDATGTATSISYSPLAASGNGVSYLFYADYSCDNNYLKSDSSDASLWVNLVSSTTTTSLSSNTITLGGSVTDSITISTSASGSLPSATGTWKIYMADNSAMTGEVSIGSGTVSGALSFSATTVSWTPTQAGTYYFEGFYSGDGNYAGSTSTPTDDVLVVNVAPTPAVSVSPSSWTMDVGQSKTFTATAIGGSGTYTSYQWYVNGLLSQSGVASVIFFAPVTSGSYSIAVTVTDSSGVTSALSTAASVTVNQLTITVTQTANGVIAPGTSSVNYGATPSFTITPNIGYYLVSITANGASVAVTSQSGQTYQFSAVSADGSLTATFSIDSSTATPTPTPTVTSTSTSQSQTSTSTPTPTPTSKSKATPTPMPTATPTSTLDPTATSSPTPLPTPLYLVLLAIIIAAIITILTFAIMAFKRKRSKPSEPSSDPETSV